MKYRDTVELYSIVSDGYANTKSSLMESEVKAIFLQSVGYEHQGNRDGVITDAICYLDPDNPFVINNHYRLEGMYLKAVMFGSDEVESWYKIENVAVNRDHLLCNRIDNVECALKKTRPLETIS